QIPLQRLGKCIEHLVSMLIICHHAALRDTGTQQIATFQSQLLRDKYRAIRIVTGLRGLQRTRRAVASIGASIEAGQCSMLDGIEPQPFGHAWSSAPKPT